MHRRFFSLGPQALASLFYNASCGVPLGKMVLQFILEAMLVLADLVRSIVDLGLGLLALRRVRSATCLACHLSFV